MTRKSNIQKLAVAIILVALVQVGFAFTGSSDERNNGNKFTLKNFSRFSHKSLVLTTLNLKTNFKYKGAKVTTVVPNNTGSGDATSMVRYTNGNTTYVYPYKFKVKVAKFKTPSRSN